MALDGKITVNDNALGRHAELATLTSTMGKNTELQLPKSQLTELNWTDGEGNIGILCNDTCLAAATLDLVYQANGKPASCLILGGYASWDVQSVSSPVQQLQSALEQITTGDGIQVVLVNILSNAAASEEVTEVITNYLRSKIGEASVLKTADRLERPTGTLSRSLREPNNGTSTLHRPSASRTQLPHFVIRIVGEKIDAVKDSMTNLPVHWMDDLDKAVAQAIALAKSSVKQS
jgi:succinyl-CoA synthetase beta subunit